MIFANPTPEDAIRRLRGEGNSLADVAEQAGTTVAKVRRVVGRMDKAGLRARQEAIARAIDAEDLPWGRKAAKWHEQTGQSEATFWRVLQRMKTPGAEDA